MKPDTLGSLRLRAERAEARAEKAEARVKVLEGANESLNFHIAASPQHRPAEEPHPWDAQ